MSTSDDEDPGLAPSPPQVGPPSTRVDPVPVTEQPPPDKRGRAGRNLPVAVGVGLLLAALLLLSLYVDKVAFVGLAGAASIIAVWELAAAMRSGGIRVPVLPVTVGGMAMLVAGYVGGIDGLVAALSLTVLAVLVWALPDGAPARLRDTCAGVFAAVYIPFLAGFAVLLVRADDGPERILVFVIVTVCSDVGGYAAGVLFGRHALAPSVSPKKSWEGFAGSVLACALGGALTSHLLVGASWWQGVGLGLAVVCAATLGDLAESLLKRDLGIKDMGSLLPGHGGVMDRLDSLLPSAPVVYLVLAAALGQG